MITKIIFQLLIIFFFISCNKNEDPAGGDDNTTKVGDWTVQIIGDFQPLGQIYAASDKNNKLHVVTSSSLEHLRYVSNSSGSWKTTTLVKVGMDYLINGYSNVAVDDNNKIHVAYHTSKNSFVDPDVKLQYVTNKTGTFETEEIPVTETPGSGISILSKSGNIVHIFYGSIDMKVVYLTNLSGSWVQKVIGNYWTSLVPRAAFDSNDNIYVALEEGWDRVLRLALINSSGDLVSNSIIDNSEGWSPSIAINPSNNDLIISYWDPENDVLKLYHNGVISTVTPCPWSEGNITFDKLGKYYFTYYTLEALNLGTNKTGSLELTALPFIAVSSYSDIVLQSDGKINIFFNDKATYKLTMITK